MTAAIKAVLQQHESAFTQDDAERYFDSDLQGYRAADGIGRRIHDSAEGRRFYSEIARERYFARLLKVIAR